MRTSSHGVPIIAGLVAMLMLAAVAGFLAPRPASAATITVNTQVDAFLDGSDGKCSLREAIINADADAQIHTDCPPGDGEDTIVFQAGVTMITLILDLPAINDADGLTIDGGDTVTISGDNTYRPFFINSGADLTLQNITLTMGNINPGSGGAIFNIGTLTLDNVDITNSNAQASGGAIWNSGTATMTGSSTSGTSSIAGDGGAIGNSGTFTIKNSDIDGTAFGSGGGISSDGELIIMNSSTISGHADRGGGIYNQALATITDSTVNSSMAFTSYGGIWNSESLTLNGSTVSGNTSVYVAGVFNDTDSTLIIENGSRITGNIASSNTGGVGNNGETIISDSRIDSNTAAGFGGGINNSGDVTITESSIDGNHATAHSGGGIEMAHGTLTITNSGIMNNTAGEFGGALDSSDGTVHVTITDTTISGNSAVNAGGGIYSIISNSTFTVNHTTLSSNSAMTGGAIRNDFASMTLANSTVSGNTAQYGGGIYSGDSGTTNLINSTVTKNTSTTGGLGGGIYNPDDAPGATNLSNTIVAEQLSGADCAGLGIISHGHNMDSLNTCNLNTTGDIHDGNANLGPLADNGGPTLTHALHADSDAIDAGDDSVCAADPINNKDQRNVARPIGPHCDIGSYEAPLPSATPTPTATPVHQTEKWGDNNCDGDIDLLDVDRGLRALALPETLEPISGCPDMGESIDFVEIHPASAGTLIWGDLYCINGLNGIDVLVLLHYIAGTETIPFTAGFCPEVDDEVVFDRQQ